MAHRKPARAIAPTLPCAAPTIIEFLLDETGSMSSCKEATVAGFNDFLSEQKNQGGDCLLTLTKFDTSGIRTPFVDLDIQMVPQMEMDWFIPRSSTNLRDTIGRRISSLKERLATWKTKPNVLFVVMTDGGDNASREYTEAAVQSALSLYMQEDGWTFVYLGANQSAEHIGSKLGFPPGNIKSFATAKMRETMQGLARATTAYRATRSKAAVAAETEFFNQ
jgi:hypothetical protein